jgi:hypothetical protein
LAGDFATLPLLGQLVVMEMTYPKAWNDHVFWASVAVYFDPWTGRVLARLTDRATLGEAAAGGVVVS